MAALQCFLMVLLVLLVGCSRDQRKGWHTETDDGGTSGTPTTLTDSGGDLFDPGIVEDTPCCFDIAPFRRLSFVTETDTPCPAGTDEGATLHADFLPPDPHTCACSCSAPSCTLPDGMHTNAAKCADADGSTALAFGPGNGWDGACSSQDPVPGGIQCGGVPCVASVTVPAIAVSPCEASGPVASKPDATWGRTARECTLDLPSDGCEEGEVCPPAPPEGFDLCLYGEGDLDCPPGWQRSVYYLGIQDDRDCTACGCEPPGAQCEAYVIAYSDSACDVPAGSVIATVAEPACFDVPSGIALGSAEASFLGQSPGSCASTGGAPTGAIAPDEPVTLCCRSALVPPG